MGEISRAMEGSSEEPKVAIKVENFSFAYGTGGANGLTDASVLKEVNFEIEHGSRVLVVGLNGSGKSTLLRCLSGQHWHIYEQIEVLGKPAFFDNTLSRNMTYLGSEWRNSLLVKSDVPVARVLKGAVGYTEEKMAELTEILNIDAEGSMHLLSDGQRQGVQIGAALMKEFKVLLMDETTVECDVLVRKHLLEYLKRKTEQDKATIMYATHVFDGMASWPTHIMHVSGGHISLQVLRDSPEYKELIDSWDPTKDSPLSALVEKWLERDWAAKVKEKQERKNRPATVEEKLANTRDSNIGDRFYNYWN